MVLLRIASYVWRMLRIIVIMLALAVGFDLYMFDGRYTTAAKQLTFSIFHHSRLM